MIGGASSESASVLQILGQCHPIAACLPIGLLGALFLYETALLFKKKETRGGWGLRLLIATAVSFFPAVLLGVIRAMDVTFEKPLPYSFVMHRNFAVASFAVALLTLGLRVVKQEELVGKVRSVYLKAIFFSLLLAIFSLQY